MVISTPCVCVWLWGWCLKIKLWLVALPTASKARKGYESILVHRLLWCPALLLGVCGSQTDSTPIRGRLSTPLCASRANFRASVGGIPPIIYLFLGVVSKSWCAPFKGLPYKKTKHYVVEPGLRWYGAQSEFVNNTLCFTDHIRVINTCQPMLYHVT